MNINNIPKSKLPLVSICIPNYNYGRFLDHCLESVYNQTYPNIEVYFRDNQSTDNSYDIALKWRKKFLEKGIYYRVSENKRNMGSDRNSALSARDIEGEYMYVLASDDAIKPEFIQRCLGIFLNNNNVSMVMTHREEIDDDNRIYKTPPFYNTDCIVDGEEQAAVYMMAGIAIPGQRLIKRAAFSKVQQYGRLFEVAGDWYNNFLCALAGDVAYITDDLCQYRVHKRNETNESERKLLGITEHYQLIHAFYDLADSFHMEKPKSRYKEAVNKLGFMCLRYALKMYKCRMNEVAYRYLLLAPVYNASIVENEQYLNLIKMKSLKEKDLINAIENFEKVNCLERTQSYDPPEMHWKINKNGEII